MQILQMAECQHFTKGITQPLHYHYDKLVLLKSLHMYKEVLKLKSSIQNIHQVIRLPGDRVNTQQGS